MAVKRQSRKRAAERLVEEVPPTLGVADAEGAAEAAAPPAEVVDACSVPA